MNVVIICDGNPPRPEQLKEALKHSSLFIAADGGAFTAKTMGVEPDVIIGDLDSYSETGGELAKVIHDPDQETNDLEKALAYAYKMEGKDVVVFGATGNAWIIHLKISPFLNSLTLSSNRSFLKTNILSCSFFLKTL